MNKRKKHERKTPQEQMAIAREWLDGHDTQREVAARHGIDRATLGFYVMKLRRGEIRLIAPALKEPEKRRAVLVTAKELAAKVRRYKRRMAAREAK